MEPLQRLGRPSPVTTTLASERPARIDWGRDVEVLYRDETPGAVRLAYLLTGDPALAEDLAQDAFVRVASRLRRLRDPGAFRAYLRRTVVNAAHSHFRHQKVVRRHVEQEGRGLDHVTDPPDVEVRDAIWAALGELPHRQRAGIVCRYYLDLTEHETAAALGVSVGTVKSSVSRGLTRLRELLERNEVIDHG